MHLFFLLYLTSILVGSDLAQGEALREQPFGWRISDQNIVPQEQLWFKH